MYVKKRVLSFYGKKFKTEERLDKVDLLEITTKKADIKLDELHTCLQKKKEGKFCLIFCPLKKLTWKSKLMHHGSCLFLFLN